VFPSRSLANTLVSYVGEQRSLTWAKLTQDLILMRLPTRLECALQGVFMTTCRSLFMLPASRRSPNIRWVRRDLLDEVELTDEEAAVRL